MPPSRAMAIAIGASVTVSIAAVTKGICNSMLRENFVVNETSLGRTSEYAGISSTSSNVSPSITTLSAINDDIIVKILLHAKLRIKNEQQRTKLKKKDVRAYKTGEKGYALPLSPPFLEPNL